MRLEYPSDNFRFFFFYNTTTTEIYTLSLHDALPISGRVARNPSALLVSSTCSRQITRPRTPSLSPRSEEHTSELQSRENLVCRLLLEKKKGSCCLPTCRSHPTTRTAASSPGAGCRST